NLSVCLIPDGFCLYRRRHAANPFLGRQRRVYGKFDYAPLRSAEICFFLYRCNGSLHFINKNGCSAVSIAGSVLLESKGNLGEYSMFSKCGSDHSRDVFAEKTPLYFHWLDCRRCCGPPVSLEQSLVYGASHVQHLFFHFFTGKG